MNELDKLSAEKIMGWPERDITVAKQVGEGYHRTTTTWSERGHTDGKRVWLSPGASYPDNLERWEPSKNLNQAQECVARFKLLHFKLEQEGTDGQNWRCKLVPADITLPWGFGDGATANEAILRACLKMVKVDPEDQHTVNIPWMPEGELGIVRHGKIIGKVYNTP